MRVISNSKKVTTQDVADAAGVSQTTVSMILSQKNLHRFPIKTIESVNQIANDMGYIRKTKKKKTSNTIVAVSPTITNPYYATLIEAIQEECINSCYNLVIYNTSYNNNVEADLPEFLNTVNAAGVIYTYFSAHVEKIKAIANNYPTVLIGDYDERLDIDSVKLNSFKSGVLIANHFLSLGHKKMAFISTSIIDPYMVRARRFKGMERSFIEAGYPDGVVLKTYETTMNSAFEHINKSYFAGYHLTKELLQSSPDITAFAGLNDTVACGIIDALTDENYKIPEDFSVIGCDNTIVSSFKNIELTTIEHHVGIKGSEAVSLLLRKIKQKENEQLSVTRIEYEPKLVIRRSTGICKK